jgi:uncharacterized damage-inducible protein DinB
MEIRNELLAEFDNETAATRKMLEAIPEGADFEWKPAEKSMTLGALAGHIAEMPGEWAHATLTLDRLEVTPENPWKPFKPGTRAEALAQFDKGLAGTRAALEAVTPEKWDQHWQFAWQGQVVVDEPRYRVLRTMVLNHLVHHRAQLGVYIRLLGGKLPGVYGPSADEA